MESQEVSRIRYSAIVIGLPEANSWATSITKGFKPSPPNILPQGVVTPDVISFSRMIPVFWTRFPLDVKRVPKPVDRRLLPPSIAKMNECPLENSIRQMVTITSWLKKLEFMA
jgi:hypothetical protein